MDSMWATGPILFRSDPTGRIIEAWREMTNRDGEYCGRDIVWLDYWRKQQCRNQCDRMTL
jgi:hypothetical protein